jgi:hypothetical protein
MFVCLFQHTCYFRFSSSVGWTENVRRERQDGLHCHVHNHYALGPQAKRQDLEGIRNEETGEANVVEDAKDPNKHQLCVSVGHAVVCLFEHDAHDGPAEEGEEHAWGGTRWLEPRKLTRCG